jgi:hypothetical protein
MSDLGDTPVDPAQSRNGDDMLTQIFIRELEFILVLSSGLTALAHH